jgi:hypothetical protein
MAYIEAILDEIGFWGTKQQYTNQKKIAAKSDG